MIDVEGMPALALSAASVPPAPKIMPKGRISNPHSFAHAMSWSTMGRESLTRPLMSLVSTWRSRRR